jgi:hypothetical protein
LPLRKSAKNPRKTNTQCAAGVDRYMGYGLGEGRAL